jgi:hypothetical protein
VNNQPSGSNLRETQTAVRAIHLSEVDHLLKLDNSLSMADARYPNISLPRTTPPWNHAAILGS